MSEQITRGRRNTLTASSPAEWALESHALAKRALLPRQSIVDDAYYRAQIAVIDEPLALGGLRLATILNQSLPGPPPR